MINIQIHESYNNIYTFIIIIIYTIIIYNIIIYKTFSINFDIRFFNFKSLQLYLQIYLRI